MSVKIRKKLQVLSLIERAKEDFKKELEPVIAPEILKTLEGGNNPIKGGKQAKYSESYLKAIKGPDKSRSSTKGASSTLKFGKNGKARKTSKVTTGGLGAKYGKLKSPVNLKLTGELHQSIKVGKTENGVRITFDDPKAIYHNNIGVGSSKVKRRLLPTNNGEEFNFNILKRIVDALKKAVKKNS